MLSCEGFLLQNGQKIRSYLRFLKTVPSCMSDYIITLELSQGAILTIPVQLLKARC